MSYFPSSASYRVRIALALKGLDYDYIPVHLQRNEQFAESYAALSPARLVPLLKDDESLGAEGKRRVMAVLARHAVNTYFHPANRHAHNFRLLGLLPLAPGEYTHNTACTD